MSLILGLVFLLLFRDWFREGLAIMHSVSGYELGLYITIGIVAIAFIVLVVLSLEDWVLVLGGFILAGLIITGFALSAVYEGRLIHFGFLLASIALFWYVKILDKVLHY